MKVQIGHFDSPNDVVLRINELLKPVGLMVCTTEEPSDDDEGSLAHELLGHLFLCIHRHEEGPSIYPISADKMPTIEQAVKALDIDYEPDRGEDIDFVTIYTSCIVRL